ncbi:MAG: hypothetical protein HFJ54_04085 [Clostridia bacterium]|nr:hypothetical protein [Clostridia bacterium]
MNSGSLNYNFLFNSSSASTNNTACAVRPVASITWGCIINGYAREK